ncbi:putative quinol monooxygenase [Jatrophihabitans sp. YIM 134969]
MIFITAKFLVKPEDADAWPEISRAFTEACNAEPGCRFFEWSRSVTDPNQYVLIEAFVDGDAGAAHVNSDHFKQAQRDLPPHLQATPKIISQDLDQDDWNDLGELAVD